MSPSSTHGSGHVYCYYRPQVAVDVLTARTQLWGEVASITSCAAACTSTLCGRSMLPGGRRCRLEFPSRIISSVMWSDEAPVAA